MKHANPLFGGALKTVNRLFGRINKKCMAIVGIFFLIAVILPGSVLAYSLKLKQEGDIEYKNLNYAAAMGKYQKARSYWFLGKVSSRLGDRDLETKIGKADVMIRSGQNYLDGVKEFESGNFDSAKYYFSRVALNDPNYDEVQNRIKTIENNKKVVDDTSNDFQKETPIVPTKTPTSQKSSPAPTSTLIPSASPTPTLSYTDLHCPRVVKIEDSLGNNSQSNNLSATFKKGEVNVLTVKITATDPQNLPLYFQYQYTNFVENRSKVGADWSNNTSYSLDVSDVVPGVSKIISVYVDNQDGYRCSGGNYDTDAYFNYTVTP